jgi:hypothetical protein
LSNNSDTDYEKKTTENDDTQEVNFLTKLIDPTFINAANDFMQKKLRMNYKMDVPLLHIDLMGDNLKKSK